MAIGFFDLDGSGSDSVSDFGVLELSRAEGVRGLPLAAGPLLIGVAPIDWEEDVFGEALAFFSVEGFIFVERFPPAPFSDAVWKSPLELSVESSDGDSDEDSDEDSDDDDGDNLRVFVLLDCCPVAGEDEFVNDCVEVGLDLCCTIFLEAFDVDVDGGGDGDVCGGLDFFRDVDLLEDSTSCLPSDFLGCETGVVDVGIALSSKPGGQYRIFKPSGCLTIGAVISSVGTGFDVVGSIKAFKVILASSA